jgi:cytochrome P450
MLGAVEYNPFSYALQDDPFAVYAWLREEAPLYRNSALDLWALSRFEDVWNGHADWKTFSSAHGTTTPGLEPMYPWMLHSDPPEATRLRNLVSRAFTPQRVARLEGAIRALAEQTLAPLLERQQCDIVGEFSARVAMDVISEMLGFPSTDRARVREWADHQVELGDGRANRSQLAREMEAQLMAYCAEVLAERRHQPRGDLMTALDQAEIEDETGGRSRLSDPELLGFVNLLTVAGSETVSKFLGNAVVSLATHPDVRSQLVANPGLIPGAVEELLRHDGVVHYQARTVMRDVVYHGQTLPEGATVFLILGAANRDEREFPEPDRLDISRKIERRLYFGYGPHFCLGANLARLEARILLETLLAWIPEYEVEGAGLVRARTANLRGYASVPIRYRARGPGRV